VIALTTSTSLFSTAAISPGPPYLLVPNTRPRTGPGDRLAPCVPEVVTAFRPWPALMAGAASPVGRRPCKGPPAMPRPRTDQRRHAQARTHARTHLGGGALVTKGLALQSLRVLDPRLVQLMVSGRCHLRQRQVRPRLSRQRHHLRLRAADRLRPDFTQYRRGDWRAHVADRRTDRQTWGLEASTRRCSAIQGRDT
jgi:hypothetical protein